MRTPDGIDLTWRSPDGTPLDEVIGNGEPDSLPFAVRLRQQSSTGVRRGDLLWTLGLGIGVVSDRFVDALTDLGVDGWSTYPIAVEDRQGRPIEGYQGLVADTTGASELVSGAWWEHVQSFSYFVTERVAGVLLRAAVDGFDLEPTEAGDRVPPGPVAD